MTATSPGSQPDPQKFLTDYARKKETEIAALVKTRVPGPGAEALTGQKPINIAGLVQGGAIEIPGVT